MNRFYNTRPRELFNKITIFVIGSTIITVGIILRLFQLQVLSYDYYQNLATQEQYGLMELPAQRGNIIIKDYHSGEEFAIATNTTLNLLFVDPAIVKDAAYVTNQIAPLIFDIELERATDNERIEKLAKNLPPDITEEEKGKILKPLSDPELEAQFRQNLLAKVSEKQRTDIILGMDLTDKTLTEIKNLNLAGIEIINKTVHAHPSQISSRASVAEALSPILEIPAKKLETILKGENRYVILRRKLDPQISDKIKGLRNKDKNGLLSGLAMKEEYFRFYPEGSLAANIIGYVNNEGTGQYGIESSFNTELQGVRGKLQTKKASVGRQITVGESTLQAAVDGDDISLTIDRSIQLEVEKILEKDTKAFQADSGQVLIMNPKTGAIIAMANSPSFDPNNYGEVFKKVEVKFTPEEIKKLYPTNDKDIYYFYVNDITLDRYVVFEQKDENGNSQYYRYENLRGPEVYHNKIISWPYEPGSVFKPIVMSSAM
ncbi:MAG: penicillin-binding transpeptidase domain-containing protein, partial [Patescibacteria group bacterium]